MLLLQRKLVSADNTLDMGRLGTEGLHKIQWLDSLEFFALGDLFGIF